MAENNLEIRYLGQTGFALRSEGIKIVLDPYLSDYVDRTVRNVRWERNYPPPCTPQELADADIVLLSHTHCDHTDPDTVIPLYKAGKMVFAGPHAVIKLLRSWGFSKKRLLSLDDMRPCQYQNLLITPVAAAHEQLHNDKKGHFCELSFHLTFQNGVTVFFGGDMCLYPGLAEKIPKPISVAFLPINGRSEERRRLNIVGNLTSREAADFADLIKAKILIPTHYDLYDINGEDPAVLIAALANQYPEQIYYIIKPGKLLTLNELLQEVKR